jgi:hypothetical protein
MAGLAVAFPGTLYYIRKEIGLVNVCLLSMLLVLNVTPCTSLISATIVSGRLVFPTNVLLSNFLTIGNDGEGSHVVLLF